MKRSSRMRRRPKSVTPTTRGSGAPDVAPVPSRSLVDRARGAWRALDADERLRCLFFVAGLVVYAATRLFRITLFPAYFFCDEANQAVHAKELLDNGFMKYGVHFPTYLDQFGRYILGTTVYLHLVADRIFGMTVFGVRAVSALTSALVPLSLAAALRFGFKVRAWWLAAWIPLLLPCWFVHSRTAFETTVWVSFYALCALVYVLYRYRDPRFLYALPPIFAAAFFAYQTAPVILFVTGVLLAASDFRYHRRHGRILAGTLALFALFVGLPYLRAMLYQPFSPMQRMQADFGTIFWFQPIPWTEKLVQALQLYATGLSPVYWLGASPPDILRHQVPGHPHLPWTLVPFFLVGLYRAVLRIDRSGYRLVLALLVAVPFGGAIVGPTITRLLAFVVPFTLLCTLGADTILSAIARFRPKITRYLAPAAVTLAAIGGLWLTVEATVRAPARWQAADYRDMQWGFSQLADKIRERAAASPDTTHLIDPEWANGTDVLPQFFFPGNPRVRVRPLDNHFLTTDTKLDDKVFVIPPEKSAQLRSRGKFALTKIDELRFPSGEVAFEFHSVRSTPEAQEILREEDRALLTMRKAVIILEGEPVSIRHSPIDMGRIGDAFDGNQFTLIRGAAANPYVLELTFSRPRELRGVALHVNDGAWRHTAVLENGGRKRRFSEERKEPPATPAERAILFGGERITARRLRLELHKPDDGEKGHVHIREVELID